MKIASKEEFKTDDKESDTSADSNKMEKEAKSFYIFEEDKVIKVKECNYGLYDKIDWFYLCSCFGEKFSPICQKCIEECHKGHVHSKHKGNQRCKCGELKHIVKEPEKTIEENCLFSHFKDQIDIPLYYNKNTDEYFCEYCAISESCVVKLLEKDPESTLEKIDPEAKAKNEDEDEEKAKADPADKEEKITCACTNHDEMSSYKLNIIFEQIKTIMKTTPNFNINILMQNEDIKNISVSFFRKSFSDFISRKDKNLDLEFFDQFKVFIILTFIKDVSFNSAYKNINFNPSVLLKDLNDSSLSQVRGSLLELLVSQNKIENEISTTNKILFAYYIFIMFFQKDCRDHNANSLNFYSVLNMNVYQRILYMNNSKEFRAATSLPPLDEKFYSDLNIFISEIINILGRINMDLNESNTIPLLPLYKIMKKLIKRNLVEEKKRIEFFQNLEKLLVESKEYKVQFSLVDQTQYIYIIMKLLFYALLNINDRTFFNRFNSSSKTALDEDSLYCFVKQTESNLISSIFFNNLSFFRRKIIDNEPKGQKNDIYFNKICDLLAGDESFYEKNIKNLKFMDEKTFGIFKKIPLNKMHEAIQEKFKSEKDKSDKSIYEKYFEPLTKFSNDLLVLNEKYFNYEIKVDKYLLEFQVKWDVITKKIQNWIPLTKKYHSIRDSDMGDEEGRQNIKHIRDCIKYTNFYQAINGFLHIYAENKVNAKENFQKILNEKRSKKKEESRESVKSVKSQISKSEEEENEEIVDTNLFQENKPEEENEQEEEENEQEEEEENKPEEENEQEEEENKPEEENEQQEENKLEEENNQEGDNQPEDENNPESLQDPLKETERLLKSIQKSGSTSSSEYMSFLLYFFFLLVKDDPENLVLFSTLRPKAFLTTFEECSERYFYCFLENIMESFFGNIHSNSFAYDNHFCFFKIVENLNRRAFLKDSSGNWLRLGMKNFEYAMKISRKSLRDLNIESPIIANLMKNMLVTIEKVKKDEKIFSQIINFDPNEENSDALGGVRKYYFMLMNDLMSSEMVLFNFVDEEAHYWFKLEEIEERLKELEGSKKQNKTSERLDSKRMAQMMDKNDLHIALELSMMEHYTKRALYPLFQQKNFLWSYIRLYSNEKYYSPKVYCNFNQFEGGFMKSDEEFFKLFNKSVSNWMDKILTKADQLIVESHEMKKIIKRRIYLFKFFENVVLRPCYYAVNQYLQNTNVMKGDESLIVYKMILQCLTTIEKFYEYIVKTDIMKDKDEDKKLFSKIDLHTMENIHIRFVVNDSDNAAGKKTAYMELMDFLRDQIDRAKAYKYYELDKVVNLFRGTLKRIVLTDEMIETDKNKKYDMKKLTGLDYVDEKLQEYRDELTQCPLLNQSISYIINKSENEDFSDFLKHLVNYLFFHAYLNMQDYGYLRYINAYKFFKVFNYFFQKFSNIMQEKLLSNWFENDRIYGEGWEWYETDFDEKNNKGGLLIKFGMQFVLLPTVINACMKMHELKIVSQNSPMSVDLSREILKFMQNLCEDHNSVFQNLLFNIDILDPYDLISYSFEDGEYKWGQDPKKQETIETFTGYSPSEEKKRPNQHLSKYNQNNKFRKVWLNFFYGGGEKKINNSDKCVANLIANLEKSTYSFINFMMRMLGMLLYNYKFSYSEKNIQYDNRDFKQITSISVLNEGITDLLVEMIQNPQGSFNSHFYKDNSCYKDFENRDKILKRSYGFISYLTEMKNLFNEKYFILEKETIKIKLSLFSIFNNLINQDSKENVNIINKILTFFPIELMMKLIVFYTKLLFVSYVPGQKPLPQQQGKALEAYMTDARLNEGNVRELMGAYETNFKLYEDDYFKLSSSIFMLIVKIAELYKIQEVHNIIKKYDITLFSTVDEPTTDQSNDTETTFITRFYTHFIRKCEFIIKCDRPLGDINADNEQEEDDDDDDDDNEQEDDHDDHHDDDDEQSVEAESELNQNIELTDKELKRIYFFADPRSILISKSSNLKTFMETVERTSSTTKLKGFIDQLERFYSEVVFITQLRESDRKWREWMSFNYKQVDKINFCVSVLINFLLLMFFNSETLGDWLTLLLTFTAILQIGVNVYFLYIFFMSKYNYIIIMEREKMGLTHKATITYQQSLELYFFRSMFVSEISLLYFNLIIPLIYLFSSYAIILFPLQLLTVVKFVGTIKEIAKAFQMTFTQILSMIAFLAILILFYSNVGFYFMSNQFNMTLGDGTTENLCDSLLSCFLIYFNFGIRSGGGIGDVLAAQPYSDYYWYWLRWVTDMVFYITVVLLIMNMINGIIITTFGAIREDKENKLEDEQNKCFICSVSRIYFENIKVPFEQHTQFEHNPANYLEFFITLKYIDPQNLDNDQSIVLRQLKNKEISVFPVGLAYCLEGQNADDEEDGANDDD